MRNIYKYIDKKYLFPIFLGRIVNSGLVLAQPLILTKALKNMWAIIIWKI